MGIEYYALPEGLPSAIMRCWENRPVLPPGMTYNVVIASSSYTGLFDAKIVIGVPAAPIAVVTGTCAFGAQGSDIDFGCIGIRVDALPPGAVSKTTKYSRGVTTVCEYVEIGKFAFMALPKWRAMNDLAQYARAAALIEDGDGLQAWLEHKRRDKIAAYAAVGITCKAADGTYNL